MKEFSYNRIPGSGWKTYIKKRKTLAIKINGPFKVKTREGELICKDGYLALDSDNYPYPIDKKEFKKIYEEATND